MRFSKNKITQMAAVLPLVAMGGFAVFAHRRTQSPETSATEEDRQKEQQRAIIREYGASAPFYQTNWDRAVLMGGIINDGVGFDNREGGYHADPNWDPMEEIASKNVALASFDRADVELALHTQRGEVVPRRRNAMAITLTPEIYDPSRPDARSEFYVSKWSPAFANITQVRRGEAMMYENPENPHELSLRAWNGSQFWDHAPGQSFRYSED